MAHRITEEPTWITESALLAMHARHVERFGGTHGIVDVNVILSALARPIQRWAYDPDADMADLAAAYLVGFARSQGFVDGNKRTGLGCALAFLDVNGHATDFDQDGLYAITMAVAEGTADDAAVAAFLRGMAERDGS